MARKRNQAVISKYPNKLYSFVCEDEKSMRYYLEGLKPYLKPNIKLDTKRSSGHTAKEVYNSAKIEYNRINGHKEAYPKGFSVIACFDKDNNDINDIEYIFKDKKILPIFNNPCYEYWLYLHAEQKNPTFISSADCAEKCRNKINAKYHKNFETVEELKRARDIFEIVKKDILKAINYAKSLKLTDHNGNYTNAYNIMEEIVDLEKLK